MRRLFGLLLFLVALPAAAATKYVDSGCTFNGDGTAIDCASSGGGVGPWKDVSNITFTCGDTINIRGVHATHGSNHAAGTTEGRYFSNKIVLSGKACGSGNPLVIQRYQNEAAFIDGTADPGTWTQCTGTDGACNCGPSTQAQVIGSGGAGTSQCTATWWVTGAGQYDRTVQVQKSDGSPTYRVLATTAMTNAHGTYNGASCSTTTWQRCNSVLDCPVGEACSATSSEVDSYTAGNSGGDVLVRFGSNPNSMTPKPRVFYNSDGYGFIISNSTFVTVQNLNFRCHARDGWEIDASGGASNDNTFKNNAVYYSCLTNPNNSGSDHAATAVDVVRTVIDGNNMAYTTSEAIHLRPPLVGPSVNTIKNNWIHDTGDQNVLGPACVGTPSGIILAIDSSTPDGDNTGSELFGNLIQRTADHTPSGSAGRGIIVEDKTNNWKIHDNVFDSTNSSCIRLDGNTSANGNQIYNNAFYKCGNSTGQGGIEFGAGTASSNLVFNNTFAGGLTYDIQSGCSTCASNVIRNNIFYTTGSGKRVNWTNATGSNLFEYNLVFTSGNPAITWLNTDRACSAISAAGTGNINNCPDPLFANFATGDLHLLSTSPAKDAGSSSGMPAGRTTDINNTVAGSHGFANFADGNTIQNGTWDIGADEVAGSAPVLTISKTESQDPIAPTQTLTYTIAYQNTGTASATGVTIKDTVPTNTTFSSATAGGTLNAGVVTWTIGTVAAGTSASVQLLVTVNTPLSDGTILTNGTYSILSNELATVNGAAVTTTVTSQPVLTISKTDSPDPVTPGSQTITYTIAYSNTGNSNATSVVISDTVPAGTTYLTSSGGGVLSAGVVTWTIGTVNAGTGGTVQLIVTANSPLQNGTVIHNSTYSITSAQVGPVAGADNTTTVSVPQAAGGLQYPFNARTLTWPSLQTFSSGITANAGPFQTDNLAGSMTQSFIGTIIDPAAPVPSAGPSSGGTCRNDKAYRFYVSYQNSTGTTKLSAASNPDFTPSSGTTNKITVTRPPIGNNVTNWIPWYAEAATPTTIRGCGTLGLASTATPAATTFDCFCGTTQDPVEPATNTTSNQVLYQMTQTAGVPAVSRPQLTVKEVCAVGCDYTTAAAAVAAISDASDTKRYAVYIRAPYNNQGDNVIAKSYVSVVGDDKNAVKIGAINITGTITEFAATHLTVGVIQTTGSAGAGGWLYFSDLIIGYPKTSPLNQDGWYDTTGGWNVVLKDSEVWSGWDTVVTCNGDNNYLANNNYHVVNPVNDASCWTLGACAPGGSLYDFGSTCTLTATGDPDPNNLSGMQVEFTNSSNNADTDVVLVNPVIRLSSTNAGHTTKMGCFQIRTQGSDGGFKTRIKIINPDCYVSGSVNTPLYGLSIDSDTDHSNYDLSIIGGKFDHTGGSTWNDVDNADTNMTPHLVGLLHSGAYTGAGTEDAGDVRQGRFGTKITIPTGDLVVGTCTVNTMSFDTGGATKEFCVCGTANTWGCWKLSDGTFNANGPAD